ncbi:hypothetical protein TKK_0004098 [Trichogramma kaykai]
MCLKGIRVELLRQIFDLCKEIGQEVRVDATGPDGWTALHLALSYKHSTLTAYLLRNRADPNTANGQGKTALHLICQNNYNDDFVDEFFDICYDEQLTLDLNVQDKQGRTPLHLALHSGNKRPTQILLRRGADTKLGNKDGSTPLHVICEKNNGEELAKMLLDICEEEQREILIKARDKKGRTPLELAVLNLLPKTVDMLLEHGADLSNFVFPTEASFVSVAGSFKEITSYSHSLKIRVASGMVAVIHSLEEKGFEMQRSEALMVMTMFDKYGLCEKLEITKQSWYDKQDKFVSNAKEIIVKPDAPEVPALSLYDLTQLPTKQAAECLTYADYTELELDENFWDLQSPVREACSLYLCEIATNKFFREWTIEPYMLLINNRLPLHCCDIIIEMLSNQDLRNICLVAEIPINDTDTRYRSYLKRKARERVDEQAGVRRSTRPKKMSKKMLQYEEFFYDSD